jgi:hypothetical protein
VAVSERNHLGADLLLGDAAAVQPSKKIIEPSQLSANAGSGSADASYSSPPFRPRGLAPPSFSHSASAN